MAETTRLPAPAARDRTTPPAMRVGATDGELVERARTSRAAFAELYRRLYPAVAGYVFRRTGDRHATEEIVSDVFFQVLRRLESYRDRGRPFRLWVLAIATNAVHRWARGRRRWVAAVERAAERERGAPQAERGEGHEVTEDAEGVQAALLALPVRWQAVLSLHHLEGLAVGEVAAVLGVREGTVKSRLARGRAGLLRELRRRREA